jgi:hypothetical protein
LVENFITPVEYFYGNICQSLCMLRHATNNFVLRSQKSLARPRH